MELDLDKRPSLPEDVIEISSDSDVEFLHSTNSTPKDKIRRPSKVNDQAGKTASSTKSYLLRPRMGPSLLFGLERKSNKQNNVVKPSKRTQISWGFDTESSASSSSEPLESDDSEYALARRSKRKHKKNVKFQRRSAKPQHCQVDSKNSKEDSEKWECLSVLSSDELSLYESDNEKQRYQIEQIGGSGQIVLEIYHHDCSSSLTRMKYKKGISKRSRIGEERQAVSSPIQKSSILINTPWHDEYRKMLLPTGPPYLQLTDTDSLLNDSTYNEMEEIGYQKQSSLHMNGSRQLTSTLSHAMSHLKRNISITVGCPGIFLPPTAFHNVTKDFNYYQESLITCMIDGDNTPQGISLLCDFCTEFSPSKHFMEEMLSSVLVQMETSDLVKLLTVWQQTPHSISISRNHVEAALSNKYVLATIVSGLQLSIMTSNLCDPALARHTAVFSLLSFEKSRGFLLWLAHNLKRQCESTIKTLLSIQRLLSLGYLASFDKLSCMNLISGIIADIYEEHKLLKEKELLIASIEAPEILVSVCVRVLTKLFKCVEFPVASILTLSDILSVFHKSLVKQCTMMTTYMYEELVMLFYFTLWGTVQFHLYRVSQSTRNRLLRPGLGKVDCTDARQQFAGIKKILEASPSLTPKISLYIQLIECILD